MSEHRRLMEVSSGSRGDFAQWLWEFLDERAKTLVKDGIEVVPENQKELFERERMFGAAAELANLRSVVESTIAEQLSSANQ